MWSTRRQLVIPSRKRLVGPTVVFALLFTFGIIYTIVLISTQASGYAYVIAVALVVGNGISLVASIIVMQKWRIVIRRMFILNQINSIAISKGYPEPFRMNENSSPKAAFSPKASELIKQYKQGTIELHLRELNEAALQNAATAAYAPNLTQLDTTSNVPHLVPHNANYSHSVGVQSTVPQFGMPPNSYNTTYSNSYNTFYPPPPPAYSP